MCVVIVAPHLIGLFQLYSLSFKLHAQSRNSGMVDQVVSSTLKTIRVLLEVIERVDAPFCENLIKILSRFLSDRQTQPAPGSLVTSEAVYNTLLFYVITEEMRSEMSLILTLLFEKLSPVALSSVLLPPQLSPLFFIVYQVLDIAVHDKNRVNQRQALKSLKKIILALSPSPISSLVRQVKEESKKASSTPSKSESDAKKESNMENTQNEAPTNVVASIVPGILTSCTRIILGDFKQGDGVFCAALDLLSVSIVSTMADIHNAHLTEDNSLLSSEIALSKLKELLKKGGKGVGNASTEKTSASPSSASSSSSTKQSASPSQFTPSEPSVGTTMRTSDWFKKASYHISLVLERIFSMSRIMAEEVNSVKTVSAIVIRSGRVRLEMAKSSSLILALCRRSLAPSFAVLFELLVLFAFDEFEDVASTASHRLQSLETESLHLLLSSYAPHVSTLVQSMPRIMRGADEHKKLLLVRLIAGWTRISSKISFSVLPALTEALAGFVHLLPLAQSLVFLNPQVSLLTTGGEDSKSTMNGGKIDFALLALTHLRQTYQTQFAYFKDKRIYEALVTLIRHLGAQGFVENYFDVFFSLQSRDSLDDYSEEDEGKVSSSWISDKASHILILNEIMMGASGFLDFASDRRTKLSRDSRSKLKDQWEHYLSYLIGDDIWSQGGRERNTVFRHRLVLAMEGIGNMSMVFGKQFEKYFVLTLYRLLAMAGSEVEVLNRVGKMTLVRFAHHTGYATVVKMVESNLDYVVEEMTRELRYSEDVNTALKVFSGLLALRSALIVPLLDDIIEDIFKRLDFSQEGHSSQLIGVLTLVIRVVSSHIPSNQRSRLTVRTLNHRMSQLVQESFSEPGSQQFENFNFAASNDTPSASHATDDILGDFTMHAWLQRCELEYLGRKDLQRQKASNLPYSEKIDVNIKPSSDDTLGEDYATRGESRMSRGQDAENEDDAFARSRASRTLLFQRELAQSYAQEDEAALVEKGGFGLAKWLRTRIARRKNEAAALDSMHNPKSSDAGDSKSQGAESFFRDHHKEKEEKAERGEDLHDGAEESSRAGDDDDIDSDEEYKYPEDYISLFNGGDAEGGRKKMEHEQGEEKDSATKSDGKSVPKKKLRGKFVKMPHRPGYDVVHSIVLRLVNWMSVPEVEVKCAVLKALSGGLSLLAEHRKVLLPALHTVWLALQWRFLDQDERVVQAAWQLVREVGRYARNFLAQKFCDLWPLLRDLVRSHNPFIPEGIRYLSKANIATQYSEMGRNSDSFVSSNSFKIQSALLTTITFATQHLSLPSHTVLEMSREVWFYLSASQPLRLQSLALSFYQSTLGLNRDHTSSEHLDPQHQVKGSEANGIFLLLSQLAAQPRVPPTKSNNFLSSLAPSEANQAPSSLLPSLTPSQTGILPQKFKDNPDAFFSLFLKNTSTLLLPTLHST